MSKASDYCCVSAANVWVTPAISGMASVMTSSERDGTIYCPEDLLQERYTHYTSQGSPTTNTTLISCYL